MKAVILTRVSSKEQEDRLSLDAQNTRLTEYAKRKNLEVINSFQIVESSTKGDRKKFREVLEFCKKQKETIALLADAVDRVQRSFKESVILDDLVRQEKLSSIFAGKYDYRQKCQFNQCVAMGFCRNGCKILRFTTIRKYQTQ